MSSYGQLWYLPETCSCPTGGLSGAVRPSGERLTRRVDGPGYETKIPMLARKTHLTRIVNTWAAREVLRVSCSAN